MSAALAPTLFPDPDALAAARADTDAVTQRGARKKLAEGEVLVIADIVERSQKIGRLGQKLAVEMRNEAALERIDGLIGEIETETRIGEALTRVVAKKIAREKQRVPRVRP